MDVGGLEPIYNIHVPELRLALPQTLANQIIDVDAPVSLVLTIPAELVRSSLDPEVRLLSLRSHETSAHFKVNTVFMIAAEGPSLGANVEVDTMEDLDQIVGLEPID